MTKIKPISVGYIDESGGNIQPIIVKEIERLYKLDEENTKLKSVLKHLYQTKIHKEMFGKDEMYIKQRDIAWEETKNILNIQ